MTTLNNRTAVCVAPPSWDWISVNGTPVKGCQKVRQGRVIWVPFPTFDR